MANQSSSTSQAVAPALGLSVQKSKEGIHQLKKLATPKSSITSFKPSRTIQRYIVDAKNNDVVTDDGHYRMNAAKPSELLAHHGSGGPKPGSFFNITGTAKRMNSKGQDVDFQKYRSKSQLLNVPWAVTPPIQNPANGIYYRTWTRTHQAFNGPNDCGMYATGLLKKNRNWGSATVREWYDMPNARWVAYHSTIESYPSLNPAPAGGTDRATRPQTGQALVITPPADSASGPAGTSKHPNRCNFHAAPVVLTAGSDYITNEANACDAGRTRPHWKISGSKKAGQSWHESYKDDYKDSRNKRRRAGLNEMNVWPTTEVREP